MQPCYVVSLVCDMDAIIVGSHDTLADAIDQVYSLLGYLPVMADVRYRWTTVPDPVERSTGHHTCWAVRGDRSVLVCQVTWLDRNFAYGALWLTDGASPC